MLRGEHCSRSFRTHPTTISICFANPSPAQASLRLGEGENRVHKPQGEPPACQLIGESEGNPQESKQFAEIGI